MTTHRPWNVAVITSLLLCALVGIVWLRSTELTDHTAWKRVDHRNPAAIESTVVWLIYGGGGIQLSCVKNTQPVGPQIQAAAAGGFLHYTSATPEYPTSIFDGSETTTGNYGFVYSVVAESTATQFNWTGWSVTSPLWAWMVLFGILPALKLLRLRRKHRLRRAGRCVNCGYDLTGNVSGSCPECGTAVPAHVAPHMGNT